MKRKCPFKIKGDNRWKGEVISALVELLINIFFG